MILSTIADWNIAPGTLLEWHPTDAVRIAAAPDPGRPSFLQENHVRGLWAGAQAHRPHRAYLAVTTEVDGELDTAAMTRALDRFVRRHGGLQTWFSTDGRVVTRMRVDPSSVGFEVRPGGHSASPEEFTNYVLERFAWETLATSWPGFAFGAVTRTGAFTLYFGCDHALSDAASQALVLPELIDFYNEEAFGSPTGPFTAAEAGSFTDYARIEHERAAQYGSHRPEIAELLDIFRHNGNAIPSFPLDLGLEPGATAPMWPIEIDLLDRSGARAFDTVCKAWGARYIAGILAAVAITDFEVAERRDYYGLTVISTRGHDYPLSQGWFCNFALVAFPVHTSSSFTELLAHAHAGYERALRLAAVPMQSLIGALIGAGVDPRAVTASPNLLSYIDFRRLPYAGSPTYERGRISTGEGETGNASMWFNRDDTRLYAGCQSPGTPFAQQQLARYHAHLRSVLAAVARDGDYAIGRKSHHAGHHHRPVPAGTGHVRPMDH